METLTYQRRMSSILTEVNCRRKLVDRNRRRNWKSWVEGFGATVETGREDVPAWPVCVQVPPEIPNLGGFGHLGLNRQGGGTGRLGGVRRGAAICGPAQDRAGNGPGACRRASSRMGRGQRGFPPRRQCAKCHQARRKPGSPKPSITQMSSSWNRG